MILGIGSVVKASDAKPGAFYVCESYSGGSALLQCIENPHAENDMDRCLALILTVKGDEDLYIGGFPSEILVEIENVCVRVDPPSVNGSAFSTSLRPKMLVVAGDEAILMAQAGGSRFSWAAVSITNGKVLGSRSFPNWVSFGRWSLVAFDGDEEIELATFESSVA